VNRLIYTSQTRLHFDPDELLRMGISQAYVSPCEANNEYLAEQEVMFKNLERLKEKAEQASAKGLEVYPFLITINHPEGSFKVPDRYRKQKNLDGSTRPEFICFLDELRQSELLTLARKAVELGFERIAFDDDLRDAFCYCDTHLMGFPPFRGRSREEIGGILNGVLVNPEHEELRRYWYNYKRQGMECFAQRLEAAIHEINPKCRIGICTSAKRCQDFSGRKMWDWAKLFHSEEAPTFVRLCGECYDDSLMSLVQSTGWHQYTDRLYPSDIERKLEITAVQSIGYRSPGAVLFETRAIESMVGARAIHWAWTEDYPEMGLPDEMIKQRDQIERIKKQVPGKPSSVLSLYIGEQLGPYTPPNIVIPYGATHDPITAYNIISLVGIPIIPVAEIPEDQPAILSSAYISREMIEDIDHYIGAGGVAILDATAARCYRAYGGGVEFAMRGPSVLHKYEIDRDGQRMDMIVDAPTDSVFTIEGSQDSSICESFDIQGQPMGTTVAIFRTKQNGSLVVMGYDLSRMGARMVRTQWRRRLLSTLRAAGVEVPVSWNGSQAVQVVTYDGEVNKVALINYNPNQVTGRIGNRSATIGAYGVEFFKMRDR